MRRALSLALLALSLALAACGGGGSSSDARKLIDDAFGHPMQNANLTFEVQAQVSGVAQLAHPLLAKVSGPYASNGPRKLPRFDLVFSLIGVGPGFSGRLISTGENAYLVLGGTAYEVGRQFVSQLNSQLAHPQTSGKPNSLSALGIDPRRWISDVTDEGAATVDGASVEHVRGRVDVGRVLTDLNGLAARGHTGGKQLTPAQISQARSVVKDPAFDVYVTKGDHSLRRAAMALRFDVPAKARSQLRGASGGSLDLSLTLKPLTSAPTVTPPANPQPLSALIGGLLNRAKPKSGNAYGNCIQQSGADSAAIARCSKLLG